MDNKETNQKYVFHYIFFEITFVVLHIIPVFIQNFIKTHKKKLNLSIIFLSEF